MKNQILIFIISIYWIINLPAQTLLIDDPLTDRKTLGQVVHVYSDDPAPVFTAEGWQPGASTKNQNHILYDVPYFIKEGFIEFEIKGMQNPASADYDPGFCGLYDGRGIDEPILYFDDFKKNFYRWNVHFRGDKKILKCKIQMPHNTEERELRNKAVFNTDTNGSYAWDSQCLTEPDGQSQSWSKTTWYKIKVEWKSRKFTVIVNGTTKWSTSLSCDYTPRDFKIWLGCAPGDPGNGKYKASIPDLTYRNFKLYTYDVLEANVSCEGINLPLSGYITFMSMKLNDTVTKTIIVQNLKNIPVTVNLSTDNSDYSISETGLNLQPNEKKYVMVNRNTTIEETVRGVINLTCAHWASNRTITCIGSIIGEP